MIWNSTLVQCVCSSNSFWNGNTCIFCTGGMIYNPNGCQCPTGLFYNTTTFTCVQSGQIFCQTVSYASWNGTNCVCYPGYTASNNQCICNGLPMSNWCNLCYQKPNSVYSNGICMCISTYYEVNGSCVNIPTVNTTITTTSLCNVGTYWDSQVKQCLTCSDGCLSCVDCYDCLQCELHFTYNSQTSLCN